MTPAHEISNALADDHRSDVGVGAHTVGHDRRVGYAQILQAVDLAIPVDDGQGVGAHFAGGRNVVAGSYVGADPLVEGGIRCQLGIGRGQALGDQFLQAFVFQKVDDDADGFSQALGIEWVVEVIVVEYGLLVGVDGTVPWLVGSHLSGDALAGSVQHRAGRRPWGHPFPRDERRGRRRRAVAHGENQ
jgi:hypothetical protein